MKLRSTLILPVLLFTAIAGAQVSEEPSRTITTGKAEVTALAIAPKGDRILVGLNDGAVMHDINTGKKIHTFVYNEDKGTAVYHVGFNDNGEYSVLIGHSGKRTVWNNTTGEHERVITTFRWIPDPRSVKAMGLQMSNTTFDRFYQQGELRIGDMLVRSGKKGIVEFIGPDEKVLRTIVPENKDQHHRAPLLLWENQLLIGTDDGKVLFYDVL